MARIVGMPGPTAGSAVPVGRARTLAQVYRHFGEVGAAETSPLYERVAVALSESDEALRAIEAAPARRRHPTVILAALHHPPPPRAAPCTPSPSPDAPRRLPRPMPLRTATLPLARRLTRCWERTARSWPLRRGGGS